MPGRRQKKIRLTGDVVQVCWEPAVRFVLKCHRLPASAGSKAGIFSLPRRKSYAYTQLRIREAPERIGEKTEAAAKAATKDREAGAAGRTRTGACTGAERQRHALKHGTSHASAGDDHANSQGTGP